MDFKKCAKKLYNVWVCMPPLGTYAINRLETPEIVKVLNGKLCFLPEEMERLKVQSPQLAQYIMTNCYSIDMYHRFLVSGTRGELYNISFEKLTSSYLFADKTAITLISLLKRSSLKQCSNSDEFFKNAVIDWCLLESKPSNISYYASFIPKNQEVKIQNKYKTYVANDKRLGDIHGLGDFVLTRALPNGRPDLSDQWVVYGQIFQDLYNNKGWIEHLDTAHSVLSPDKPTCINLFNSVIQEDTFLQDFFTNIAIPYLENNVISKVYKCKYQFTKFANISEVSQYNDVSGIFTLCNKFYGNNTSILSMVKLSLDIHNEIKVNLFLVTTTSKYIIATGSCSKFNFISVTKDELKQLWRNYKIFFWFMFGVRTMNANELFKYSSKFDATKATQGVALYAGGSFKLNGILAGLGYDWNLSPIYKNSFRKAIECLDHAMKNTIVTHDLPVLRCINYKDSVFSNSNIEKDTSYKSSSFDFNFSIDWGETDSIFFLMNLKGKHATYARNTYTSIDEKEIVLPRNYSYKLLEKFNFYSAEVDASNHCDIYKYDNFYIVDLIPTPDGKYKSSDEAKPVNVVNSYVDLQTTYLKANDKQPEYVRFFLSLQTSLLAHGYHLAKIRWDVFTDSRTVLQLYETKNIELIFSRSKGSYCYTVYFQNNSDKPIARLEIPNKLDESELYEYADIVVNKYTDLILNSTSYGGRKDLDFIFDTVFRLTLYDWGFDIFRSSRQVSKTGGQVYRYILNGDKDDNFTVYTRLPYKSDTFTVEYRCRANGVALDESDSLSIAEINKSNNTTEAMKELANKVIDTIARKCHVTGYNKFNRLVSYVNKKSIYRIHEYKVHSETYIDYTFETIYDDESKVLSVTKNNDWEYLCQIYEMHSEELLYEFTLSGYNTIFNMYRSFKDALDNLKQYSFETSIDQIVEHIGLMNITDSSYDEDRFKTKVLNLYNRDAIDDTEIYIENLYSIMNFTDNLYKSGNYKNFNIDFYNPDIMVDIEFSDNNNNKFYLQLDLMMSINIQDEQANAECADDTWLSGTKYWTSKDIDNRFRSWYNQ